MNVLKGGEEEAVTGLTAPRQANEIGVATAYIFLVDENMFCWMCFFFLCFLLLVCYLTFFECRERLVWFSRGRGSK